ncbi:MAG: rhodanese-like domain-containing protein [Coleofasciculaceae cyanobacterium]
MSFKKSIQTTILLGFALCFCFLVGIGQNPILAATLVETEPIFPEKMQTMSEKTVNLESTIDRFLTSIPPGYYMIANIEGLKKRLKNPQTMLVDVREPSEYKSGHIPHAINIPLQTLAHNLEQIPHDSPRCAVLFRRLSSGNGSNDTALIGL